MVFQEQCTRVSIAMRKKVTKITLRCFVKTKRVEAVINQSANTVYACTKHRTPNEIIQYTSNRYNPVRIA